MKPNRTNLCRGIALTLSATAVANAQQPPPPNPPKAPVQVLEGEDARAIAAALGWITRATNAQTGATIELVRVIDGEPQYYTTFNQLSGETIRTADIQPWSPLADGSTITLGLWDEGRASISHQELVGRVSAGDNTLNQNHDHATHVAGTMIATGVNPAAKGMAPLGLIRSYEWTSDETEMGLFGATGYLCSNHSYCDVGGWQFTSEYGWVWYGGASQTEDSKFGQYDSHAQNWDAIATSNPKYLIVKAAGNDGNDTGPGNGGQHRHWDDINTIRTDNHQADATPTNRFDTITTNGNSKNIITVGAVEAINGGWNGPNTQLNLAYFSSCGPADDLRIKPDVVADGVNVFSCIGSGSNQYASYNGTSRATPAITGSAGQLMEYWRELNNLLAGIDLRSATIKGLIIHTARAPGDAPNAQTGWGLMVSLAAALVMKSQKYARNGDLSTQDNGRDILRELTLANGEQYETTISGVYQGQRVRVTLCWTDPAHAPISGLDDTTPALVNDLDLIVHYAPFNDDFKPWRLETAPARTYYQARNNYPDGQSNTVDNVELVEFVAPAAGDYIVRVTHKGTLAAPEQFSLLTNNTFRIIRTVPGNNSSFPSAYLNIFNQPEGGAMVMNSGDYHHGLPPSKQFNHPMTIFAVDGEVTLRP